MLRTFRRSFPLLPSVSVSPSPSDRPFPFTSLLLTRYYERVESVAQILSSGRKARYRKGTYTYDYVHPVVAINSRRVTFVGFVNYRFKREDRVMKVRGGYRYSIGMRAYGKREKGRTVAFPVRRGSSRIRKSRESVWYDGWRETNVRLVTRVRIYVITKTRIITVNSFPEDVTAITYHFRGKILPDIRSLGSLLLIFLFPSFAIGLSLKSIFFFSFRFFFKALHRRPGGSRQKSR